MKKLIVLSTVVLSTFATAAVAVTKAPVGKTVKSPADSFLQYYDSLFLGLTRVAQEAQWLASTDVSDAHDGERTGANTALAVFQGDRAVIESCRAFLAKRASLPPLVARELDKILLAAAEGPGTIPDVVKERVAAESRQSSTMDGYTYKLDGKPVSANDIDDILHKSTDLALRRRTWEASKEMGKALKPGLQNLQKLRNQVAREMKHASYFALQVADYDMSDKEMMAMLDGFLADTRPLYQKLHAWVRLKLAQRYKQPVPNLIPAHWINNRWSQEWTGIVDNSVDMDPLFKDKSPEWIVKTAEKFWVSLGFPSLPGTFWERSDLYPVPATAKRKKNAHASCWHIDLQNDIRSLMSVQNNAEWFRTAHHELGHAYYFISYSQPEVPAILRQGANRAMHEAMGDLAAIAASQPVYLKAVGVLPQATKIDERAALLDEALESAIPFIAWSAGTMAHFEHDLYGDDLSPADWQARWWEYVAKYQGVAPPDKRSADGCDACSKTHINDLPAQYYNYALSTVIKYQLHDHICRKILNADPHSCNYYGHKEVGDFLRGIMKSGATRPWRDVIKDATGEPLSTRAMNDYFKPLDSWLDGELKGQKIGW
ncbi:MAG TPA: M2 family metallopeptidase [Polyangia bacterium]|nr:M2 family metallopeptidase [Polyangia bacterium]